MPRTLFKQALPFLIALMWGGLLWSRALLSIAMILYLLACLAAVPWTAHLQHIRKHRLLLFMPLLFLAPAITLLWSEDTNHWLRVMQNKLPLLLIPLLSLPLMQLKGRPAKGLFLCMGLSLLFSLGRTIWFYLTNLQESAAGYLQAKVLPVDMGNDHVRYAWLLVIIFAWALFQIAEKSFSSNKWLRVLIPVCAISIFLFQHLLASKTGLLGTYFVLLLFAFLRPGQFQLRSLLWIIVVPLAAWVLLPTFRNRLKFVRWDFQHYSRGNFTSGLSDAPRIISLEAGWDIWKAAPLMGCGFGDLRQETTVWYTRNNPSVQTYEQLLPSNNYILYGVAGGLLSFVCICLAVWAPFFQKRLRKNFLWQSFHGIAAIGFLYEIGLETQFGVFIYAFIGSWLYASLQQDDAVPIPQDLPS